MKKDDHMLIQELFDGGMPAEQFERVQQRLRGDAELRKLYLEYALMQHLLVEEFEGVVAEAGDVEAGVEAEVGNVEAGAVAEAESRRVVAGHFPAGRGAMRRQPARGRKRGSDWRGAGILALGAAAAVMVGAWLMISAGSRQPAQQSEVAGDSAAEPAARVIATEESVWTVDGIPGELSAAGFSGEVVAGARVELGRGTLRWELANGVTAEMTAPADVRYLEPLRMEIDLGTARFDVPPSGTGFTVATPEFEAVDLGTRFGVVVSGEGAAAELHVFEGKVELRTSAILEPQVLEAGEAARVDAAADDVARFPSSPQVFESSPTWQVLLEEDFGAAFAAAAGGEAGELPSDWNHGTGTSVLTENGLAGSGFTVYADLPSVRQLGPDSVLDVVLDVDGAVGPGFHTAGWSGLSLYVGSTEVVFFGDSFGDDATWSIDVKQGLQPVLPEEAVMGGRMVTMRYHRATGRVSLSHGDAASGAPFVSALIAPGLEFDRVRLGASAGSWLVVRRVELRAGAE